MLATDIATFRVVNFTTFYNHYLSSSEQHYHYIVVNLPRQWLPCSLLKFHSKCIQKLMKYNKYIES